MMIYRIETRKPGGEWSVGCFNGDWYNEVTEGEAKFVINICKQIDKQQNEVWEYRIVPVRRKVGVA